MAGHSKWSNIKHRKQKQDKKKSKIFGKLSKKIQVAAREGGGDPEKNPDLRSIIDKAKDKDMPKDNIERAIKKGTGELEGVDYQEQIYEGYGPDGVAIWMKTLTDNKNRTVAEIRNLLEEYGGNLGSDGSVTWMFDKEGHILIEQDKCPEDDAFLIASEAGAEDFKTEDGYYKVITDPTEVHEVRENIEEQSIPIEDSSIEMVPENTVRVEDEQEAEKILELLDKLEDHDDVEKISSNFDIDDEILDRLNDEE